MTRRGRGRKRAAMQQKRDVIHALTDSEFYTSEYLHAAAPHGGRAAAAAKRTWGKTLIVCHGKKESTE